MIAAWLAGKVSGIIIFCLAVAGVVLIPISVVQTVRINGVSFFGWYAIDGFKPMYEADEKNLATFHANQLALTDGIKICNKSVADLKIAGDAETAAAQRLADEAKQMKGQLDTNIAALLAVKSSAEKCPVVKAIINKAFQ